MKIEKNKRTLLETLIWGFVLWGLIAILTTNCAHKPASTEPKIMEPRLVLSSSRKLLLGGGRVHFTARILGEPDHANWACPEVVWHWGDGLKDGHDESCDPEAPLRVSFYKHHDYKTCGAYSPTIVMAAGLGKNRRVRFAKVDLEIKCLR